jgi:tetratricopeptide (TPR) repeat protein
MVETQQGISTFLSFGAKSVKPEILEELLIGRRDDVDYLTKCVGEIANDGINHQIIVVGQRGMGKTHLLRVLYQRSQVFLKEKTLKIAYFSEEEYGISGYLDFLIRILNAFIRWNDEDRDALNLQMDILRETHSSRQVDVAEQIITTYIGDKPLLILAENFNDILESLGKDGQGKLRSFMYRHSRTSIIATSQALSPDLGREDRPFYNFFTTIYLKKLTYEDSLALLRQLAEMEQQQNVIDHLKGKGVAQVRAVHELVKGNHRLLVTFYEFLKADTLASLSKIFIKTLNDLKPYYETFIRYLPPQQQKILHYIALSKIPQNGTEISKNCFIDPKSLSKQLSELNRRNLIDAIADPDDKRNKLYDVSEPLLRISIEIGEHREGISALFIDFLALYYSFDELDAQKTRFWDRYENETDPQMKKDFWHDVNARLKAMDLQEQKEGKEWSRALKNMMEKYYEEEYESVIKLADKVSDEEKNDKYFHRLGDAYDELKNYPKAIEAYQKAIEIKPDKHEAWNNLGNAYNDLKNYQKAIEAYQKAIEIKTHNYSAWNNLGIVYFNLQDYPKAIEAYQKAIEIKSNKWEAWNNLGIVYEILNDYPEAVKVYQKAIEIGIKFIKNENWIPRSKVLNSVSKNIYILLRYAPNLNIIQVQHLESVIGNDYQMPEALAIPYKYLQTFRRYVLENDEKALLELPKEQREFFVREILEKRKAIV